MMQAGLSQGPTSSMNFQVRTCLKVKVRVTVRQVVVIVNGKSPGSE